MSNRINYFYEFESFRFSPKEKCLWRDGELISLSPKSLEVLNLLLEKHSEVVTREEIITEVWNDTFIEEANINVAISNLRKALKQDKDIKFIQTIPKKGYRFTAVVKKVSEEKSNEVKSPKAEEKVIVEESEVFPDKKTLRSYHVPWHLIGILLVGVFFLTSFGLWINYFDRDGSEAIPISKTISKRSINDIAVLPLKNLSETNGNRSFSIGLTDSLISRLGRLNRFAVRPLSSVETFPESGKDAIEFGRQLEVDAVMVGTIQMQNERLRLNVQLIDTRNGIQLWSKSYDENSADIFKIQDDLSVQVASNLVAKISGDDSKALKNRETENKDAFMAYAKGQFYLAKRTEEDIKKAIDFFEEAVKFDKNYAEAYLKIADSYILLSDSGFGYSEPLEHIEKIRSALDKAMKIEPSSAHLYRTRASFDYILWNIKSGNNNFEKSLQINPNLAQTRHWYGWGLLAESRLAEAENEFKLAHELDPTSRIIAAEMGLPQFYAGKFEESLPYFKRAVEMDENFFQAQFRLWYALHYSGKYSEAFNRLEELKRTSSEDEPFYKIPYAITIAKLGKRREAELILEKYVNRREAGEYISPILIASLYATLENKDESLKWLKEALKERNDYLLHLEIAPEYKDFREDKQFKDLIRTVKTSYKG